MVALCVFCKGNAQMPSHSKDGSTVVPPVSTKSIRPSYHSLARRQSTLPTAAANTVWIVVHESLQDYVDPLVTWRQRLGFRVDTITVTTSEASRVRSALMDRIASCGDFPDYVLIVGDATLIPPFPGLHRPVGELPEYVTDLYYGEFTGDYYPEAAVGRLPVADGEQLQAIIEKIIRYEQADYPDQSPFARALLVAGAESQSPAPTTTEGQLNYWDNRLTTAAHPLVTSAFHQSSTTSVDSIVAIFSQGVGLVNYSGHGTLHGWLNPTVTYSILDTVETPLPALYINNCCHASNFTAQCMGTHLINRPHGGAIGVIGASSSSFWEEDYLWSVGGILPPSTHPQPDSVRPSPLDRLLRHHLLAADQWAQSLGELLLAGNYAVTMSGSLYDGYYWELYNILGDPALLPFVGTPDTVTVAVMSEVEMGSTSLLLSGTPYAYVALSDSAGLIAAAYLNAEGTATLSLVRAVTSPLEMVVRGYNTSPLFVPIVPTQPTTGRLATIGYEVAGDTLYLTLRNVGTEAIVNHYVRLTQQQSDSTLGIWLAETAPLPIGTLEPQQETRLALPVAISHRTETSVAAAHIAFYSSTACYALQPVSWRLHDSLPMVQAVLPMRAETPATRPLRSDDHDCLVVAVNPSGDTVDFSSLGTSHLLPPHSCDTIRCTLNATDGGMHLTLPVTFTGRYVRVDTTCYLTVGEDAEGFETGNFNAYPWDNTTSVYPWQPTTTVAHSGIYSVRSGPIGHRQRSELALDIYLPFFDTLLFWYRVSSEDNADELSFLVDGSRHQAWSGDIGWSRARVLLSPGRHRIVWSYTKDDGISRGNDCAWIDDIRLPLTVWPSSYGFPVADIPTVETNPSGLRIVPNPATTILHLDFPSGYDHWRGTIYDFKGQCVKVFSSATLRIDDLPAGIYTVIVSNDHQSQASRLIVLHR